MINYTKNRPIEFYKFWCFGLPVIITFIGVILWGILK